MQVKLVWPLSRATHFLIRTMLQEQRGSNPDLGGGGGYFLYCYDRGALVYLGVKNWQFGQYSTKENAY